MHGTAKQIKTGCKCFTCRLANVNRIAEWRKGNLRLVEADRAQQLLLSFESSSEASRVLGMPYMTINRIRNGQTKRIRRTTEQKILKAA